MAWDMWWFVMKLWISLASSKICLIHSVWVPILLNMRFNECRTQGVQKMCWYFPSTIKPTALHTFALFVMAFTTFSTPTNSIASIKISAINCDLFAPLHNQLFSKTLPLQGFEQSHWSMAYSFDLCIHQKWWATLKCAMNYEWGSRHPPNVTFSDVKSVVHTFS